MLHHEFSLSKRHGFDLVCMMLDLDRFKDINDNCGHQFGDYVLKETSTEILAETRNSDTVARYGGGGVCHFIAQYQLVRRFDHRGKNPFLVGRENP